MKKISILLSVFALGTFCFAAPKPAKPVNEKCPFSAKAANPEEVAVFNICCNNCLKKASYDTKAFVAKTKAGNKECPFSGKPAKKKVAIAFGCSKC